MKIAVCKTININVVKNPDLLLQFYMLYRSSDYLLKAKVCQVFILIILNK